MSGEGPKTRGLANEPDNAELEELLARCAAQETDALATLYARVAPILLGVLMKILRRRDLAEDVLQDVFMKVWKQAGQFDHIRGRPLAWLIAITRYRAIDLQRKNRLTVVLSAAEEGLEAELAVSGPGEGAEVMGMGSALLRCLEQIAAPQRRCLVLAYQEGLTHSEIARALGEPLGTVKSWVRRSLVNLRRCIES